MNMDLRGFLSELEARGEVERIKREVSPRFEVARILKELDGGPAVIFDRVRGSEFKIVANVCGTQERILRALRIGREHFITRMLRAVKELGETRLVSSAPVHEWVEHDVDLQRLPILTHFERDGGPCITAGIVLAKDDLGRRNASFHRLQPIARNRLAIRLVPRDLYRMFMEAEGRGKPLEVAIALGVHPALSVAAATSPPFGVDELRVTASLLGGPLEVVRCRTVDLEVPAGAELVLEGRILPGERALEGPFCDVTGTYDIARQEPVVELTCMTMREDALYQAILPSGPEHQLLMGMPKEPSIFEAVGEIADVRGVHLTPGGCRWLHAVISIRKGSEEDGERVIRAAMRAHPSLKHVVVVDDDINIYDPQEVEWAIATRVKATEDVLVIKDTKGSTLDSTADQEAGVWAKMGIDATKDILRPEKFERARIG